ncbi:MAG: alanine:cation symporter family protein [Clostridia bacterium]|nr:alanine:cation symporter family protein [Clostridia bacterium]
MFDTLTAIVTFINDNILWGIPMVLIILGTGIFMTVRTRCLQVRKFKVSLTTTIVPTVKSIFRKEKHTHKNGEKSISQFEAFSAAISGTVGTGNIVGVAGAMISGGPGAVFWMWVSAFFGMVTNYSENVLGLYYRKKDEDGNFSGGPMHYIEKGLGWKPLAKFFALCCTLAAVGMSMVQVNSISGTVQNVAPGNDSLVAWIVGIAVALITALIVIGGIQRIGKVASTIVPFMALFFIIFAFVVIFMNVTAVPAAFALIFKCAFSFKAFAGGLFGHMIMVAMRYGFARGIFSNEAGLGSSVIAHSASDTREPVKQGLWGVFEVFLDTFVICTLTAVSILSTCIKTGKYDLTDIANNGDLTKAVISSFAFSENLGIFGTLSYTIILPLFAFTTIIAWSYYGKKSAEYLFSKKAKVASMVFSVIFVLLIVVGAVTSSDFVWSLDDMFNALMAIPNLIGVIGLSGVVLKITKNYFDRRKGLDVEPMLSYYPELNEEFKNELSGKDDD